MEESEKELKSLLMKVKEQSVKAGLKFNIQKTKIMVFRPISSWQRDGEKMKKGNVLVCLQSVLMEINPDYSLERLLLKLKLQYFGHLMQRASSLGKTLMLGKTDGKRRTGQQRIRWLNGIIDSMDIV